MVEKSNKNLVVLETVKTKLNNEIHLVTNHSTFQQLDYSTALIIGVFHGDEPQGKYLIEKYLSFCAYPHLDGGSTSLMSTYLSQNDTQSFCSAESQGEGIRESSILFIPCLNPDGMQLGKRTNANGVDLNRNFPTKNWGQDTSAAGNNPQDYYAGEAPASEIETQFVIDVIEKYKPKLILTLHAPYKIVNYDGPAKEIAQKISDIIGYPVEESIGYPTPGSFGTYCGVERNIPTITLELDEKIPVEQLEQQVFEIFSMI